MSTNMTLITSVTVGSGGAASVTLPATGTIPATYTDLKIVMSARSTRTGTDISSSAYVTFNGDSGSYYSTRMIEGDGSGTRSTSDPGTRLERFDIPTDNATANTFSNSEMYIPNYTSTNAKSVSFESAIENNATLAYLYLAAGLYNPPSNVAITTITLTASASSTFDQGSTFYLYGISNVTSTTKATGGIVSSDGTYNYHMFPFSGTFTPTTAITADCLIIAGGGGGGWNIGGGGGAGGLRYLTSQSLTATAYTVTIGAGGNGAIAAGTAATSGGNSVFNAITSAGGGRGATGDAIVATAGGSGGGGTYVQSGADAGGAGNTPSTSPSQGNNGGNGRAAPGYSSAGGGGAGAVGQDGQNAVSGNGGNGVNTYSAFANATQTGVDGYYAGGGGGGGPSSGSFVPGQGGLGGGGKGAGSSILSVAGILNTGSGGGGGNDQSNTYRPGANGGSGLVIIRYAI